jgi:hypothetical protein
MIRLLSALAVTVALGLSSRLYPMGWYLWDKLLGDVLYAVAAYLVWAMLLGRRPAWVIAATAFGCCLAVELFKLTGIPADNQRVLLVRWFLGTTFSAANMVCYFIGVSLAAIADCVSLRPIRYDVLGHQPKAGD